MDLIFGGAYQGKLNYVKETYNVSDKETYTCLREEDCETPEECLSAISLVRSIKMRSSEEKAEIKVINNLENFILACVRNNMEAVDYLKEHREEFKHMIMIVTDISQGIVPIDKELRAWREMTGRTMLYLAENAELVTRIFCGLPRRIK